MPSLRRPSTRLIFLASLFLFPSVSLGYWSGKESSIDLLDYFPKNALVVLDNLTDEDIKGIDELRVTVKRMYKDPKESMNAARVIQFYRDHNLTAAAAIIEAAWKVHTDVVSSYSPITQKKLFEFFEELFEVLFVKTNERTASVLNHYLHLRNGRGMSRTVVREIFPSLEKFAQIPEIKMFYNTYKNVEPSSPRVLKKLTKVIIWLDFHNRLPNPGK
ncbi:hypothetical protein QR680_014770 [Steinernema hermaphroditum]|uniref:Uncharacterized protein n=1 Tax=Steinernema hermaphroditum TaxID=289476 RepID=A0AA39IA32_9BILA|nr:hypothetical protein QR680_014770 [Steinernema hermaphroditum]